MMNKYNFTIFGDSITYGAWDKQNGGWVNRLRLAYENSQPNDRFNFFNLGISGENILEVNERFDRECQHRIKKDEYNMIIIAIGINDSQTRSNKDYVPLPIFETTLKELIQKAKTYTNNLLILGLTKVDETFCTPRKNSPHIYYYNHKIKQYDNIIKQTCLENKIDYLYLYDLLNNNELSDGLHPNEIGHQKMCDIIKNKIDQMI